jgi:hypothetical protein
VEQHSSGQGRLVLNQLDFQQSRIEPRRDDMADMRQESDSLGAVEVPADKLWGAQTQRSLEHFSMAGI